MGYSQWTVRHNGSNTNQIEGAQTKVTRLLQFVIFVGKHYKFRPIDWNPNHNDEETQKKINYIQYDGRGKIDALLCYCTFEKKKERTEQKVGGPEKFA